MLSSWQLGGQDLAGGLQFAYPCLAGGRAGVRTRFCKPGGLPDQISSRCVRSLGVVPPAGSAQSVSKVSSSWDAHAQPCSWEEAASSGSASQPGRGSLLSPHQLGRPKTSPGLSFPLC